MGFSKVLCTTCLASVSALVWRESSWAQKGILPPREAKPNRSPSIRPPGYGSAAPGVETDADRRERLEGMGIAVQPTPAPTPPPPPPPTPPPGLGGAFVEEAKNIADSGKTADEGLAKVIARASMDTAVWRHYRAPKASHYAYDYSWGSDFLLGLSGETLPENGEWIWSAAAGPRFVTYNGGVYVRTPDLWGGTSALYADTAVSELGGIMSATLERKLGEFQSVGIGLRAGLLPLRWVRAKHYSLLSPPPGSDAISHFNVSWSGLETEISIVYGYARIVEVALFSSVHAGWPWQVRARAGVRFSLLSR